MKKIIILTCLYFLIGCKTEKNNISCNVFDVKGLNSDIENITKQGFKLVPDDIIVYKKEANDTTIYLNVHEKFKDIEAISWEFKLTDLSKSNVLNFIRSKGFTMLTPFTDNSLGYFFSANRREKDNIVFYFEAIKEGESGSLVVRYYKPRIK